MGPYWPKKKGKFNMKTRKNYLEFTTLIAFISIIVLMTLVPQIGYVTLTPAVSITLIHIPVLIGLLVFKIKKGWILGLTWGISALIASFIHGVNPIDLAFRNPFISVVPKIIFIFLSYGLIYLLNLFFDKFNNTKHIIFGIVTTITIFFMCYGSIALSNNVEWINIKIIMPISIFLLGIIITLYYISYNNENESDYLKTVSFSLLATLIHTFLVLTWISVFAKDSLLEQIPNVNFIDFIIAVAGFNGIIEAFIASLIVPSIIKALKKSKLEIFNNEIE